MLGGAKQRSSKQQQQQQPTLWRYLCLDCLCLQFSWPFQMMRKLFVRPCSGEFNADDYTRDNEEAALERGHDDDVPISELPALEDAHQVKALNHRISVLTGLTTTLRIYAGTWNVAGKFPDKNMDLSEWLWSQGAADVYVIGFQEVVPLNVANVLGDEDKAPVEAWEALIRQTLNANAETPSSLSSNSSSNSSRDQEDELKPLFGGLELVQQHPGDEYVRVASKQMVGVAISIWIRRLLLPTVSNVKVSCVGCGVLGFLGNKGSVSVSLMLHQTTFCFICAHLTSGESEAHKLRRNANFEEILRRTTFPRACNMTPSARWKAPKDITSHERIILLGDLNYRLSMPANHAFELLDRRELSSLLLVDELRAEQRAGGVLEGWQEGCIHFAPTYKYIPNSDCYVRSPAWCDRVLWCGTGLLQLAYMRSEYHMSDHRPVCAIFLAEVLQKSSGPVKTLNPAVSVN